MEIGKGTRIDSFELLALIGQGGMGRVYRARDLKLKRDVAVKVLHETYRQNRDLLRRFEQEAQSASALNHPNIVTIHEIGEIEDGPFIVMELVDGPRLRDVLTSRSLTMKETVHIASGVADGLAAAHAHGIIHRDLKPENIMIPTPERAKILDFGLAKLMDAFGSSDADVTPAIGQTNPGVVLGTPGYMSPEQASGRPADHRADQFSFGAILYEMLTGRPAFRRETSVETMAAIIRQEPAPIEEFNPHVPAELKRVVQRCLCKSPDDRYASTTDLAHDLRGVVLDVTTSKATPVSEARFRQPLKRSAVWAAASLLAVALAIGAIYYRAHTSPARPKLPERIQLAILPFNDITGDPANQRIADGLADMMAARIGGFSDLQVITPAAAGMTSVGSDMRDVARQLGANAILRGSVLRSEDRIRVSYSIIDPESGIQLAADSIDGQTNDLFAFEDRMTERLVETLQPGSPASAPQSDYLMTSNAQDRYFQAVGFLQRYDDEASVDSGIAILEELQKSAGNSALAKAALGRGYLYKFKLTHDKTFAAKAEEVCREAARIDQAQPEVRVTMGELFTRLGRYPEAIASFRRVLQLRPRSPEATLGLAEALDKSGDKKAAEALYRDAISMRPIYWAGYNKLGAFLMGMERYDEAATMFSKVVELTPDNVRGYYNLAASQIMLGNFNDAVTPLKKSIAIKPNSAAWSNLGTCYYFLGRFPEAVSAFDAATQLSPADYKFWYNLGDACRWNPASRDRSPAAYDRAISLGTDETKLNPRDSLAYSITAVAYAKRGNLAKAKETIAQAQRVAPDDIDVSFYTAMIATISKDPATAFSWLQRAVRGGYHVALIEHDPEFATLRNDSRFEQLKK